MLSQFQEHMNAYYNESRTRKYIEGNQYKHIIGESGYFLDSVNEAVHRRGIDHAVEDVFRRLTRIVRIRRRSIYLVIRTVLTQLRVAARYRRLKRTRLIIRKSLRIRCFH